VSWVTGMQELRSPFDVGLLGLDGNPLAADALRGRVVLVVNVASKCGLSPQYAALQRLHERYSNAGFTVLGVPCNQFAGREPGEPDAIAAFCSSTYDVTFPLTEKLNVNGQQQHPLYRTLTAVPDSDGVVGEVYWNFEKFVVDPQGDVVGRFRPKVEPDSPEVVNTIEQALS
jgi:glutathione peroxidase